MANTRHLACLTFDFDSISIFLARGDTTPTPISRGEFGVVGAERLLDLLHAHNILATWFIPGVTIQTYPDMCKKIADAGHEIAHHGFEHVPPARLSRQEEVLSLVKGNQEIENVSGSTARGFRSPAWDLSHNTVELLLEQGFTYDSSMMAHDFLPYQVRQGDVMEAGKPVIFGAETSLVELPISWSLDDYPHFEFGRSGGLQNASQVLDNWLGDFKFMQQHADWGVLTYTCHPFVIGRGHRMLMMERLIEQLTEYGAHFVTAEQAVTEYQGISGEEV